MSIGVHLHFSGQCQEAFEFYQALLGGALDFFTYGSSPAAEHVPDDWHKKVIHATLNVNKMELAGADILREQFEQPKGFQLLLQFNDASEAKKVFEDLAEGGNITMPIQQTFWSPCYGMLTDKIGIPWEINCTS
jgi:PhnB protein